MEIPGLGRVLHFGVTVSPLDTAGGVGAICLFADLTNVVELEEQLRSIERDGMDHVFVCIGDPNLVVTAVPLLAPGGQVVIVGFPGPGVTADVPIQALYRDKSILACRYGTSSPHRDIPLLAEMYLVGRLKLDELVSNTLPLSKAATAFDDMAAGRTDARTVLEIGA